MQWSDLQVFLAVVHAGTVRGAALAMKIDASTVSRRVAALEQSTGVRLFRRTAAGLRLTPAGDAMLESSARVQKELSLLAQRMVAHDVRLSGVVRVTFPGSFTALVHQALGPLLERHPSIEIELLTLDALIDIDGQKADVAIRAAEPASHLVGRKVAGLAAAVYASREYLARREAPVESKDHTWVEWDRRLAHKPAFAWLNQRLPERKVAARGLSTADVFAGVVAGVGLGALPCLLGDAEPGLVRLLDAPRESWTSVWVLTHAELRPSARVRVVTAHLTSALKSERARIEGARPLPSRRASSAGPANLAAVSARRRRGPT